jgi:replicative DNA helicase
MSTSTPPPYDPDVERAALGCLTHAPELLHEAPTLTSLHFHQSAHRVLFRHISALIERGASTDPITLLASLRGSGDEEAGGGRDYVFALTTAAPSASNFASYAMEVLALHSQRELIQLSSDAVAAISDARNHAEALRLAHEASQRLADAAEQAQISKGYTGPDERNEILESIYAGRDSSDVISTGFHDLDKYLNGGLYPGKVYVVAARPGMGKSALVQQIAVHAACIQRKPVFFASLEMGTRELLMRSVAQSSSLGLTLLATHTKDDPTLSPAQIDQARRAMQFHADAPLYIADISQLDRTLSQLRAVVNQCHRTKGPLGILVVDYLQLLKCPRLQGRNREQEVAEISGAFKRLAAKLNLALIAVCQLNRGPESRSNKRPLLSDLRESGSLEQDADVVIFPFRESYYAELEAQKHRPDDDEQPPTNGTTKRGFTATPDTSDIIVGKHRGGATGMAQLIWQREYVRFLNLSRR